MSKDAVGHPYGHRMLIARVHLAVSEAEVPFASPRQRNRLWSSTIVVRCRRHFARVSYRALLDGERYRPRLGCIIIKQDKGRSRGKEVVDHSERRAFHV